MLEGKSMGTQRKNPQGCEKALPYMSKKTDLDQSKQSLSFKPGERKGSLLTYAKRKEWSRLCEA